MKQKTFLALAVLGIILVSGCVNNTAPTMDDKGATSEGVNSVVNANNQFAFDLYSKYKLKMTATSFSPHIAFPRHWQ